MVNTVSCQSVPIMHAAVKVLSIMMTSQSSPVFDSHTIMRLSMSSPGYPRWGRGGERVEI